MIVKIDARETALIIHLKKALPIASIEIVIEQLPLGDCIICDNNLNEIVMFERKTLKDLASSIQDGRYLEQGYRLDKHPLPNHCIYYIIEGNINVYKPFAGTINKQALLSSIVSIGFSKGFSIHKTLTIEETAEWILHFAHKLDSGITPYKLPISEYNPLPSQMHKENTEPTGVITITPLATTHLATPLAIIPDTSYASVVPKTKGSYVNPENIGIIMLSQIPGISSVSATAILEKFGSLHILINIMTADHKCLDGITTINKTGGIRKLTATCIKNMFAFLIKKI